MKSRLLDLLGYLLVGFFVGFLLLPAAMLQTNWAQSALHVDMACCETAIEGAGTFAMFGGFFLGPLLGVFTTATCYCYENKLRATRFCALTGAFLGGALPLFVALTSHRDTDFQNEPNSAWLVIISVSLPLIWAGVLLLFGVCVHSPKRSFTSSARKT